MSDEAPDTYTWLLTHPPACPACGAAHAPDAPGCGACGRSFMALVRPARRSPATMTLVGLWWFGLLGAVLAIVGTGAQILGLTEQTNNPTVLRWLVAGSLLAGLVSTLMAWGLYARQIAALYVGMLIAVLAGTAGVVAAFLIKGLLGLLLASGGLLTAIVLLMTHVVVLPEFRGELRRQTFETSATSALGLYQEGRAAYQSGLRFLAAQRWARAIGKEPGNVAYVHALGLVLAQLGHRERALGQLERALRLAPSHPEIRRSYELMRHESQAPDPTIHHTKSG
jgi:hypothetical protein